MIHHANISVLFVVKNHDSKLAAFFSYLRSIPHVKFTLSAQLPHDLSRYDVVVSDQTVAAVETADRLRPYLHAGGGWLLLVHRSDPPLPELLGVQPGPAGPAVELRVLFHKQNHPMAARLPEAFYLDGHYRALDKTADDTEIILYADWHYQHSPVLVKRTFGDGQAACATLQAFDHPVFQQILYRLLNFLAGRSFGNRTLGIGLLGYAPSVGRIHGIGAEKTPGFTLRAACDMNPERLRQAGKDFPDLKTYASAEDLAVDADVDLVIVATPPNTHAQLCLQMMAAGKHVVCEKPLALNRSESAAMVEMAEKQKVHLSCHQNRRWDPDYLAIKQALKERQIGDLFYMETFVGGFSHPCGYWHSHAEISGGTAYDWGSHYLDWVVSLIPEPVTAVVGTRHKRVWHDVTNADQERVQIRFAGGQEAEFLHSDIAAVRKPKWYLLGTQGAIVGHWHDVTTYQIDPLLYFQQHEVPATEMSPHVTLHRRHPSGQLNSQKLSLPERQPYMFHRNLADHLLAGEPIVAPLQDSVRVVAILEAAARSAANGGTVEVLID